MALVLSSPGRQEELAGYPAARTTGKNLEALLLLLGQALRRGDLTRENVTRTNAWPSVEYLDKTGRSEATHGEILAPDNLRKLRRELAEIGELVIFAGKRRGSCPGICG